LGGCLEDMPKRTKCFYTVLYRVEIYLWIVIDRHLAKVPTGVASLESSEPARSNEQIDLRPCIYETLYTNSSDGPSNCTNQNVGDSALFFTCEKFRRYIHLANNTIDIKSPAFDPTRLNEEVSRGQRIAQFHRCLNFCL